MSLNESNKRLSIDPHQHFHLELIRPRNLIKVSMMMSIDEFENDMLSNSEFRNSISYTEIQKCKADNCTKKYVLLNGRDELGGYCFNCCDPETGEGYYCENCCKTNMVNRFEPKRHCYEWYCNKCDVLP